MSTIGERIRMLRKDRNLTQEEVGKYIGTTKQTLFKYETNIITNIPIDKIDLLSKLFNVSPGYIMGWEKTNLQLRSLKEDNQSKSVPLLGNIAAGTPILAEENIERFFVLDTYVHADFALRIHGDSMIDEGIYNEDIVFIRQQPDVENGEIAAVLIDDSATLKKVYKQNGTLILQAANSKYQPRIYNEGDIRILGKLAAILNIK